MSIYINDVQKHWIKKLTSRRVVGSSCDVLFDFNWQATLGHNQPRFSGLHDLSQTICQYANTLSKTPILLLTTDNSFVFDEIFIDELYIAIINIHEFMKCTSGQDRSATFFLATISKHGPISAVAQASKVSIEDVDKLIEILKESMENESKMLIDAVEKGGTGVATALINATVLAINNKTSETDLKTLANSFSSGAATFLSDVASAARKRIGVEEFEQLLLDDANEHKFQKWFLNNSWVLGTNCVRILDERRIDVENVADYLVEALDGRADIIEIKRPRLCFWKSELDHDNYVPHSDLVAACIQSQNYQFALERQMDSILTQKRLKGIPIAKPSSLLIHGRSSDWNDHQFEAQRLLNAGFTNLCILTYDQVLLRAKALCGMKVRAESDS